MPSYSNYQTYLKYKNCCRPIGDTGPPGPVGPTGPAATIDIPGNKGEILYFSETDTLDNTNNVFIQQGNVTINNNLVVTGNLSMNDNFINDVSGIYFSDGTYIGHGSSFDITTSERLDISAAGGITVTGNLIIDSATTLNGDLNFKTAGHISSSASIIAINTVNLNIDADTIIDRTLTVNDATTLNGNLNFKSADHISSSGSSIAINTIRLTLDAATTINSNLSMNDNFINDVSGIYFSDGNYIDCEHGVGELYVNGNTTLARQVQLLSTLDVSGATIIRSTLDISGNLFMNDNFINDVSGIYFTQGNLLFSDFSTVNQSVQLPSSQGQPISLERKTLFNDENFNINTGGIPIDISFVVPNFNQLGLTISGSGNTIISPSLDISGQYVEIYANFLVNSTNSNSKTISLDISGVSSGSSFNETIDVRSISKLGRYYITFGPHIFTPEQWAGTSDFVITANTSDTFDINKYKLMFKSYFM